MLAANWLLPINECGDDNDSEEEAMTKPADERTAKAREQFKCIQCAGSGRVMMGALTSAVCPKCDGFCSKRLTLSEIVEALASERSSVIKEAREECKRAMCAECRKGDKPERRYFAGNTAAQAHGYWVHTMLGFDDRTEDCAASKIYEEEFVRGER